MSGSPDGGYALYVDITYKDGSNTWGYTVPFDTGTHGWQYKAGVIDEGKPIKSLTVHAMFRWHTGTVRGARARPESGVFREQGGALDDDWSFRSPHIRPSSTISV